MKFLKQTWILLLFIGFGLVAVFPIGFIGSTIVAISAGKEAVTPAMFHFMLWGQNIFIMFLAPMLWCKWYLKENPWQVFRLSGLPTWQSVVWMILFVFLSMPALELLSIITYSLPFSEAWHQYLDEEIRHSVDMLNVLLSGRSVLSYIEAALLMCVFTGLGEEVMFRGALRHLLDRPGRLKMHGTAIVVGLVFALIHFELFGLLDRWLLGTLYVYIFYYTRSIWPTVLAHFINNLVCLIQYYTYPEDEYLDAMLHPIDNALPWYLQVASVIATVLLFVYLVKNKEKFAKKESVMLDN